MKPNLVIDTRGLFCPMPIIKASEAMQNIDSGALIEVISDDLAIEHDMPAWCRSHGHAIESERREGDVFYYVVRKAQSG